MRRPPFFRVTVVASTFALALGICSGCKTAPLQSGGAEDQVRREQPMRISFQPPDGKLLHERSITTRTQSGITDRLESFSTSRFDRRKDAPGWVLTQFVTQLKSTRVNDRGEEAPPSDGKFAELVTRFPVKLELADDGAFVRLENPEDAQSALSSTFPDPAQAPPWVTWFSPSVIEETSRREWEAKYAGLFDRNLLGGATLYSVETLTVGDATSAWVLERKLTGRTPSTFGETAVFSLRCIADASELKDNADAQRALQQRGSPQLEPSVQCEGQQQFAISPFVPTRSWVRLTVRPGGQGPELTLNREVSALKLE